MFKVAKRGMGGVGNVINTLTTAAVDMVTSAKNCHILENAAPYKSSLQTEHSYNLFSPCMYHRQVFSPEVPIVRKPSEELMFLFRAVCAIFDALADKSNAGDSIK
jgi:hypothetical protein